MENPNETIFNPDDPADVDALLSAVAAYDSPMEGTSEQTGPPQRDDSCSGLGPGKKNRDEERARLGGIPFPVQLIINAPLETLHSMMQDHYLNQEQAELCRDIRRRGKNRIAATNCRVKKKERRERLKREADRLHRLREERKEENECLRRELHTWQERAEDISEQILRGKGLQPGTAFLEANEDGIKIITNL